MAQPVTPFGLSTEALTDLYKQILEVYKSDLTEIDSEDWDRIKKEECYFLNSVTSTVMVRKITFPKPTGEWEVKLSLEDKLRLMNWAILGNDFQGKWAPVEESGIGSPLKYAILDHVKALCVRYSFPLYKAKFKVNESGKDRKSSLSNYTIRIKRDRTVPFDTASAVKQTTVSAKPRDPKSYAGKVASQIPSAKTESKPTSPAIAGAGDIASLRLAPTPWGDAVKSVIPPAPLPKAPVTTDNALMALDESKDFLDVVATAIGRGPLTKGQRNMLGVELCKLTAEMVRSATN